MLRSELWASVSAGATPALLALSCAALAAPAHAEEAASPQTTEQDRENSIVVDGQRELEVESPKATAPLLDTPQTITVISAQTIQKQNLLTLRDALSTVPGITFGAGEGGGGYGDSINLRGYSANNDITIDGIRDSAQYTRSDPFNLQQIEVYNGANSVNNGSGSLGGTINLASKTPTSEDLTVIQAGIGTDNYYRGTVDSNMKVNDLIAVRLNAMYHHNDIPGRDVEKNERWGIAPSITIGVDGPTSLTLAYVHQSDDNVPIYGVPYYAAGGGPVQGVDDSDYFGIENLDKQKLRLDRVTAIFSHEIADTITIRNLTRYQRVYQPTVTSAPQGTYCLGNSRTPLGVACTTPGFYVPSGPRGLVRDQTNDLLYDQVDLRVVSGSVEGIRNTFVIGASYAQEDYKIENAQLLRNPGGALPNPAQPNISIGDPNTIWTGPVNRILTGKSYGDTRNMAIYGFDTLELNQMFEFNVGLRYEDVRTIFRADTVTTPVTGSVYARGLDQTSDETLFSYRGGLVFKPVPNASLYVSYANSKTPSSATVRAGCGTNCDVAPEKGRSFEIGGKLDLFGRKLQLTAAVFRNERTNFRIASNDPVLNTIQVLDGKSRVDGVALGASGNITPNWTIFANYTYLDSTIRQGISNLCIDNPGVSVPGEITCAGVNTPAILDPQRGDDLVQTPKHSGSLFTTYSFPFGLQIGYGFTYQGSFALNQSTLADRVAGIDQFRSKDWMTHRAFASYALAKGITAQVNVQNFTNERYFTSIRNNGWAAPAEDRSAVASIYYSF